MRLQVLHIDDCPSWVVAGERARIALDALGLTEVPVEYLLLHTAEEAAAVAFAGSPTILIDGEDAVESDGRTGDLACRVYLTERGLAGAPTQTQLEEAVRARM